MLNYTPYMLYDIYTYITIPKRRNKERNYISSTNEHK